MTNNLEVHVIRIEQDDPELRCSIHHDASIANILRKLLERVKSHATIARLDNQHNQHRVAA